MGAVTTKKMICSNTLIFLRAGQNITRCYKWSGVTVATDLPLKMLFVGVGHPSPVPKKWAYFKGRVPRTRPNK
jgi:hypothetical protein